MSIKLVSQQCGFLLYLLFYLSAIVIKVVGT